MTQPVTISFQYTEAEYVAAVRQYFDPFRLKLTGVVGLLILSLGIFMLYVSDDQFLPWFLSLGGVTALVIFYRNYYFGPRHWYRAISERGEYTLQYSDAGIVFHSKDMDSTLQWSLYHAVRETDRFYFLVYGKDMFSVIPKRAFTSVEQEESFRGLLRRHLAPRLESSEVKHDVTRVLEEYAPKSLEPPDWR